MEISMELGVVYIKLFLPMLALNDNNRLSVFLDTIIYFLAFLYTKVSNKFRYNFQWVKHIVTKCCNKRHYKSIFCCFLSLNSVFHTAHFLTESLDYVNKVHDQFV